MLKNLCTEKKISLAAINLGKFKKINVSFDKNDTKHDIKTE